MFAQDSSLGEQIIIGNAMLSEYSILSLYSKSVIMNQMEKKNLDVYIGNLKVNRWLELITEETWER